MYEKIGFVLAFMLLAAVIAFCMNRRAYFESQLLGTIFRYVPCIILTVSPSFDVLMANKAACKLAGLNEKGILGRKCYDIFGDGFICPGCAVANAVDFRSICRGRKHKQRPDGTDCYIEQTAVPVFNRDGSLKCVMEISLDVTKRAELEEENERIFIETVSSLANLIGSRDRSTGTHSQRVRDIAVQIGKRLQLPQEVIHEISISAILHDIGKIGIPENILNKTGSLTPAEFAVIQRHTVIGYNALKNIEPLRKIANYIHFHHESFDGRGYPRKLTGEAIPLVSRILSVADVFEALTADRVYRKAMPFEQAMDIMQEGRATKFDPVVFDAFSKCVELGQIPRNKATVMHRQYVG